MAKGEVEHKTQNHAIPAGSPVVRGEPEGNLKTPFLLSALTQETVTREGVSIHRALIPKWALVI